MIETATVPAAETRRRELGSFLRTRRERLTPASVGLPEGFRRRTQGLRREEVALRAGCGTTWYTWLEQGRDVHPSTEMLSALAEALRLDPAERRHLFILSGRPVPETLSTGPEVVAEPLRRMLASLTTQPAYVLGRRWDILAWNSAAEAVFGAYGALQGDERNVLHLVFANPRHRALLVDWEPLAREVLALFRSDAARFAGDPDFDRLVSTLTAASAEFRAWWSRHDVLRQLSSQKRIDHPAAGRMVFEHATFAAIDQPDLKLVVYTPLEESQSGAKLQDLLRAPAKRRPALAAGE